MTNVGEGNLEKISVMLVYTGVWR